MEQQKQDSEGLDILLEQQQGLLHQVLIFGKGLELKLQLLLIKVQRFGVLLRKQVRSWEVLQENMFSDQV